MELSAADSAKAEALLSGIQAVRRALVRLQLGKGNLP